MHVRLDNPHAKTYSDSEGFANKWSFRNLCEAVILRCLAKECVER